MARTQQDLATRVAEELGVIAAGETLSAADAELIKARYVDRLDQLKVDGLAYWHEDAIPAGAMEGMTIVMADICAPAFGFQREPGREQFGLDKLAEHTAIPHDNEVVEVEYF